MGIDVSRAGIYKRSHLQQYLYVVCDDPKTHHRDKSTTQIPNFYKIEMVNLTNEDFDYRRRKRTCR